MKMTNKMVNLHNESIGVWYVQKIAEHIANFAQPLCNAHRLTKRITREKQVQLYIELIAREPRPVVESVSGGRLRRAQIVGDGTKKSPYRAEWCNDYYIDT